MKSPLRFIKIAALASVMSQPLIADTPISLTQGTSGSWNADWNGLTDRTDFFQWSLDLVDWHFFPVVEYGGGVKSYGFTSSTDKFFLRLEQAYIPSTDPEGDDYDGDGLSNVDEVTLHNTDPLKWDTDGDGMPDGWEIDHGLDPRDDGSIDPVNGAEGDPDDDGLINLYEYEFGGNPRNSDTDGDGLSDGDEFFVYRTELTVSDTDGDGLSDYDEVTVYGTDPRDVDTDKDSLSDGDEVMIYFTNPLEMDSDGDWMWDDWELAHGLDPTDPADGLLDADSDGLANQLEFVFMDKGFDPFVADSAGFPWSEDPDYDGLTTAQEFTTYHTNPRQPDTDGDEMDDGWEIKFGFNATVNNLQDSDPNNDPDADPDGDGITNIGEASGYGTNPSALDTDGDGVNDDVEINQGSNPNDPNDHSPPPKGTVAVNILFGDHSDSHSEKYRVKLQPVEGDTQVRERSNRNFGATQTDTLRLPRGSKYTITLVHVATDPKYRDEPNPDFDYTLEIPQLDISAKTLRIIHDTQGITGIHDESDAFFAAGKSADLFVMNFKTETAATIPANRERLRVGVKEEVKITVTPTSAGTLTWTLLNNLDATIDTTSGYNLNFTADTRSRQTVLRGVFDTGDFYDLNWEVVQPNGERATKTGESTYPAGTQGAGMTLNIMTLPDDVSFMNVQVIEIDKGTSNINGFFTSFPASALQHHPNPNWERLYPDNHWDDTAGFGGWGFPNTWAYGTYEWAIEVRWRTLGEVGQDEFLANRTQLHTLHDNTGKSTESKMGQTSLPRTP